MTPRRALLVLSLVAFAAPAAAGPSQSAPPAPPATAQPTPMSAAALSTAADTPIDPIAIAFDISADHDAQDAAGPKLLKYVIDFVPAAGAPGKSQTFDLGKPKPVQGSISVPLTKVLLPGTYVAHVRAVGRSLQTTTVTVGPFVITEKIGKTKAEYDKELRAPDKPQDNRTKRPKDPKDPKEPQTQPQPSAPPDTGSGKDSSKPAGKGGFWKKFYEKVVGEPVP